MTFLSRAPNHKSTSQQRSKRVCPPGSPICSDCKKPGHTYYRCFVEIGYPEWWPTKPKELLTSSTPAVHNVTASSTVPSMSAVLGSHLSNMAICSNFCSPLRLPSQDLTTKKLIEMSEERDDTISSSYPHITSEPDLPHSTSPPSLICPRRTINRPSHLRDYFCPTLSSSTAFSTHSNTSFTIKHSHWRDAIQTEIQALKANNTWALTSLLSGKKPISCKWVFKTKLCVDGLIERHKARLVAKEYTQVEGLNYHDTFALATKLVMVYCVFSLLQLVTSVKDT
ncbi:putative mitochondrial protein [Vitis vinifera]|uniref:Putative mitochondrial protein n=1 Tax=Vitis vinifera TaxID=29760 RepID=A0A438HVE0_VITVI|nr:putative mitochondrial protein [Vitis vinifera]